MQGLQGLVQRRTMFKHMYKRFVDVPNLVWQLVGHVFTFVIHASNIVYLRVKEEESFPLYLRARENELSTTIEDPMVNFYEECVCRYFTCWIACVQLMYSIIGFICTSTLLLNSIDKNYSLSKEVLDMRDVIFASVVWPSTMMVSTVFWSLYFYDRSLIYPEIMDEIIGPASIHILRTLIVPIVVWELVFRKREKPISHFKNLRQMVVHVSGYIVLIYYTYYTEGIWLQPIYEKTYGTIDFLTLHLAIAALCFMFYYLQWVLNDLIHGNNKEREPKSILN